jgi:hypothetical protein
MLGMNSDSAGPGRLAALFAAALLPACFQYTMPGPASDGSEDGDGGNPEFVFETDGQDPAADDGGEFPADQDVPVDGQQDEIPCSADHDPPFIAELPDATTTSTTATITWVTDEASTSWVDYGFTTEYGASTGSDELTTSHSVQLHSLATMTTYAYRVRSRDACGNEIVSGNDTFVTLEGIPLTAPVLVDEPDAVSPTDYSTTLEWSAVATTDGDPTSYTVEVDVETDFASPDFTSGWIMTTTWDVTVPTGRTYYWRVRAMDSVDTGISSPWSAVDAFTVSERGAPPAPVVVPEPDYYSNGVNVDVTLDWQAVTSPDGDGVEYEAQVSYNIDFTMLHATTGWTSAVTWTLSVPPSAYLYWRVNVLGTRPGSHAADHVSLYDESAIVLDGLVPDAKGALRVKLRETLPEISYVDRVRLMAVDHPAGSVVVSSSAENLYRYGGKKPFKLITASSPRLPLDACDASGKDILGAVSKVDGWPAP